MVRGITNTSGTACHISSVLIILAHCCEPLVNVLAQSTRPFVHQLGCLLQSLNNSNDDDDDNNNNSAVDPTKFYNQLRKQIHVEPQELGDAVTALLKLLQGVREQGGQEILELLEATVDGGRIHSVINGTGVVIHDGRPVTCRRRKQLKQKTMDCPLAVSCLDAPSDSDLVTEIERSLSAIKVDGYHWHGEYEEEAVGVDCIVNENPDCWQTTKMKCLDVLPNIWMIHLERFKWTNNMVAASDSRIKVPLQLNTERFQSKPEMFQLQGGILHVRDQGREKEDSECVVGIDEPDGHYIAIFQKEDCWFLVDDDKVITVSADVALDLLAGSDQDVAEARGQHFQGTLLVYERIGSKPFMQATADGILSKMKQDQLNAQWSQPAESLIGRRLKILWAKGKYYSGVIASYSVESGKHTVHYDDGDVRKYHLEKKTIEWLD